MRYKIKYIGLTFGIISIILSFLFFARQQNTYLVLLLFGLMISVIFYLTILFGKTNRKAKLFSTLFVIFFIVFQWFTEPFLTDCSYRIYIKQNQNELNEINNILGQKHGDISVMADTIIDTENVLTINEKTNLKILMDKINVYLISKSNTEIYYGLWGFLDVRLGVTYWTENSKPDKRYRQLKGNWYH